MTDVERYYYPLVLKNKKLAPFKISPDIEIRRLSNKEKGEFFGLKKVDFSFCEDKSIGYIDLKKFHTFKKKRGRVSHSSLVQRGIFDGSSDILASNYVLILSSKGSPDFSLDTINTSFALYKPTSTGGYIGFRENETDPIFHYNMRINGPFDYLYLTKRNLKKIKAIYELVKKSYNDKRFKLYSNLYMRSLEGGKIGTDLRFLLLIMTLENLYIPNKNQELSFRLKLKVAKILSKNKFGTPKEIYNKINEIYKVRSELVHQGKTEKLTMDIYSYLTNIVRISLLVYLQNKTLFSKSKKDEEIILEKLDASTKIKIK